MAIKVLMPALSPTMSEGVINKWLVNIGDTVSASIANGLTDSIMILSLSNKVFSIVNKIDQPWNLVI